MVLPTGNNMDTKKHAAKARMSHDKDNEVDTQRVIEDVNNRKEWQEVRNAVESVVVRSLRRRLWRACRTEDPIAALQCYTATRSVWEEWRRQEIVQEQTAAAQHQHNNSKGHSHPLEGFRPWRKKTQSSVKHQHSAAAAAASPPLGSQAAASISSEVLSDSNTNTTNTALGVVGLLQIHMNPSDLFVLDDYKDPIRDGYQQPDDFYDEQQERQLGQQNWKDKCRSVVSRIGVTRQAFVLPSSTPASPATTVDQEELSSSRQYSNITNIHNKNSNLLEADILMMMTTTPLHEAARMGHGALFQCMLSAASQASSSSLSYVDLDTRNGAGRTVLHCAAGGITAAEASFLALRRKKLNFDVDDDDEDDNSSGQEMDVGIPAPRPPLAAIESERKDTFSNRNLKGSVLNVARTFGKWAKFQRVPTPSLQRDDEQHTNSNAATLESDANHSGPAQQAQRDSDRMDVVKSILSWTRAGTNEACASMAIMPTVDQGGVSINSVDLSFGRTALHYGAELGRSDLCQAILQSFYGTMLTVIDCTGRTPCELAGAGGFAHLATYLEARALLFVDPYGTDEDLLTAITAQSPESNDTNNRGILPFSWFETLRLPEVQLRRERRLVQSLEKTRQIAQRLRLRHFARNTIVEDMQQANDDNSGSAALPTKESSDFRLGGDINDKDKEAVVVDRPVPTDSTIKGDKSKDNDFNMYEDQLHEAHIESFLTFHSWDVTKALEAFSSDPFEAFQTAGILLPQCKAQRESSSSKKQICLICCDEFDSTSVSWKQLSGCCHSFCADCLEDYLTECSKSRTGVVVPCPHHDCNMLMSPWEIQMLSPYDVHSALVQSANDNYVVSANDLRFCPHPGCGQKGAIRMTLPEHLDSPKLARSGLLQLVGAVCTNVYDEQSPNRNATSSLTGYKADFPAASYDGVVDPSYYNLFNLKQPKKAHRFCFHCGDQKIHWPVTCERLSEWKATIAAQVKTVHGDEEQKLENGEANIFEDVAQKLWMKANTRPCPQVGDESKLLIGGISFCIRFH